jgi:hypothetical protein
MATNVQRQAFVSLPLLRAIQRLPEVTTVDGVTLHLTGEATSAVIVNDLTSFRAAVRWQHGRRSGSGRIELSSASSWRTDLTLRLDGVGANARGDAIAERLLLEIRRTMGGAGIKHAARVQKAPVRAAEHRTSA